MPSYWSWALFNAVTSKAVVYSWQSELFSGISSFWSYALEAFWDSFKYYFWDSLTPWVVIYYLWFWLMILAVAFVASYIFVAGPLRSTGLLSYKIKGK